MTVSIDLPWLILAAILLIAGVVFAMLRWTNRVTRGQHAFYDKELSVYALTRQINSTARLDETRTPPRRPVS